MIRNLIIGTLIFISLALIGCATKRSYPPAPATINVDLTREIWQTQVERDPSQWAGGASRWFLTGDANATEIANRGAPPASAISTMSVNAPDFTKIRVNGDFHLQIFGTYGHNTAYVYGPNNGVGMVSVEVVGDTLCISQKEKVAINTRQVIVRIGVNRLDSIEQRGGNGSIEAIRIQSGGLVIKQAPEARANMFISGNINVTRITKLGRGCINLFGVNSPSLDIITDGGGQVNVSGNVGISRIQRRGTVDVNIIGANSNSLVIDADGSGKIGIYGPVNIREIMARGDSWVFAYPVRSEPSLYVYLYNKAKVGLAGYARNLYVDAYGWSLFAGRNLCSQNAFARTADCAHINVTASYKIFAAATQTSSVYFFGMPGILSQFQRDRGVIMPIWYEAGPICPWPRPPVVAVRAPEGIPPDTSYRPPRWKNKRLISYPGQG